MESKKVNIKNKITYNTEARFKFDLQNTQLLPTVSVGDKVKKGDLITEHKDDTQKQEIPNDGKEKYKVGDKVSKEEIITTSGKKPFKKEHKAEFDGEIIEITEKLLVLKDIAEGNEKPLLPEIPFDAVIDKISKDFIILSFKGLVINLFDTKGHGGYSLGKLVYMNSSELKDKENDSILPDLHRSVLVTDTISTDMYPMLSTLGVRAIVVNHIKYDIYNDLILLDVPVAIISGFGDLDEDGTITKYLNDRKGEKAWLDTDFDRLIIPEEKAPDWLESYEFDLSKVKII